MAEQPWTSERIARLGFAFFEGFGARSIKAIREGFARFEDAWRASANELMRIGVREQSAREFASWRSGASLDAFKETLARENIRVVFWDDTDYPKMLRQTSDPPEQLFYRGRLTDLPAIALVGTRRATSYGRRCVERIVPPIAQRGLVIVSGLALGIDTLVHEVCLNAQGITLAFIGAGIDEASLYPRANLRLAHRIINAGGAVVSEYPPGAGSRKEHFPVRNRLIAGFAKATVVVEAALKSGSLITARIALEENREVLAVPAPIMNETTEGSHLLLRAGAKLCACAEDVFAALAFDQPEAMETARAALPLTPEEKEIVDCLRESMTADALSERTGIPISTLMTRLSLMEIKETIKREDGGEWSRCL